MTNLSFREAIFCVVQSIPEGQTRTYKEVAVAAGYPKAYRAVGNILNTNYDAGIPCHRVIRSDGKTGGYNRGAEAKKAILKKEKINANSGVDREKAMTVKSTPYVKPRTGRISPDRSRTGVSEKSAGNTSVA